MDNSNFSDMLINRYKVVSAMSGTSLDGIDILYAEYWKEDDWKFRILDFETRAYSKSWLNRLKQLTQFSIKELKEIDFEYSKYLAEELLYFITKKSISDIDFIASHGHTALHKPDEGYTYQMGNQQIVANILNKKLICDFRIQDVKLGGQGAPLVPIGDKLLFSEYYSCINLGGFANISFDKKEECIAFDICPVNVVLNYYVSQLGFDYDDNGNIAKTGKICSPLLEQLNTLSFYEKEPPKSLGLEWVEAKVFPLIKEFNLVIKDILNTYVEHVAIQISKYLQKNNTKALLTGGGTYNSYLLERISQRSKTKIVVPSKTIIEYKEALIFGLLGVLRDKNEVNCLASVTGASKDHSSGVIFYPN